MDFSQPYTLTSQDKKILLDPMDDQHEGPIGILHLFKTAVVLFIGSIGFLMMAVLCIGVPPAMITVGIMYIDQCPIQPYIPIYLIAGGLFCMCSFILGVTVRIRNPNRDDTQPVKRVDMVLMAVANLIHCFTLAWFIAGCTWVYGIYKPSFEEHASPVAYCHKTVYLFSFWLLNCVFIAIGMLLLLGLFMVITSLAMGI